MKTIVAEITRTIKDSDVAEIIKTIKDSDTVIERDMKLLTLFFELFRLKPYQRFSALLMKKVAETATSCVYRKTANI